MKRYDIARWLPFGILALVIATVLYRLLLGEMLYWGLSSLQYYPWRQFAFSELRQGRLPFWNPYSGGGAPLLANYQSAILYPPNWVHLLIADDQAMSLVTIFHIVWAGIGMWQFASALGLSRFGRSVSMLSFSLSGYFLLQAGNLPLLATSAWLPWLFWATINVLSRRQLRYVGLLGLCSGLQLLAGHLQTSWYSYLAVGFFTIWYVIFVMRPLGRGEQISGLLLSSMGLLIGAGIASLQLIVTFELLWQSHRAGGVDFETLAAESYAPWKFLTLLMPKLFGIPSNGSYYLEPDTQSYFIVIPYIGILPLLSSTLAVRGWLQRRNLLARLESFQTVPFWLVITIVGAILAMGQYTFLYPILYDYVPTFNAFRGPERWLILPVFGLSILAGIGVITWQSAPRGPGIFQRAAIIFAGIVVGVVALLTISNADETIVRPVVWAFVALVLWLAISIGVIVARPSSVERLGRWRVVVLIIIGLDLAWASLGMVPTVPRNFYERDLSINRPHGSLYWSEPYEQRLRRDRYFDLADYRPAQERWADIRTSLLPNLNMLDRVPVFNNFDPIQPANHRHYIEIIEAKGEAASALLIGAGVGEVYGNVRPEGWEGSSYDYVAPVTPLSAWTVAKALWTNNPEEVLMSDAWNPTRTVVIETSEAIDLNIRGYPSYREAVLEVIYERPTERRYRVQSDGSGYLVIANTWYPGWEVSVDGQKAKLLKANLAFQAVEFPEGDVTITFEYTPTGLTLGVFLSMVSLFAAIIVIAVDLFRSY